jgi:DNA topoisomerase-1
MAKNLVIVESPAKAKTISRFLGKDYRVLASFGHVRDLPKSQMGVDIENNFEPTYQVSTDKKKVISGLKKELKLAETLYIATDEDREGEAIGWHLLEALKVGKKTPVKRIVFHEITKSAIMKALENPRQIDNNVVGAQQARRVLDRLVGYELSPLLWKKVRYGLSAGRVQSVAVRLVVERERAIEAFDPKEYWKVLAQFENKEGKVFGAELKKLNGKKLEINNKKEADAIKKIIDGADFEVSDVEEKEVKRNPAPPFITSTLQQEAARKLGFSVKKTMMVAQQLYEGLDTGKGETGLITYMRTDSVNLSSQALKAAKDLITKQFGKDYALDTPRRYKGRKGAQEAHEAIRPVDLTLSPAAAAKYLNKDQSRLYELIWKRTIACQMAQAILNQVGVDIEVMAGGAAKKSGYQFRATGQSIKFAGFMSVYMEDHDDEDVKKDDEESFLPALSVGEAVKEKEMNYTQHFTKPPARYTEASLVKKLESEGIGRPSTYAPTIGTIIARGYIEKDGRQLKPKDIAMIVIDLLVEHFKRIVDYKFTANMEDQLDAVEEGKIDWVPMLAEFYKPFHENIEKKDKELKKEDLLKEKVLGVDEKSGMEIVVRHGRFGAFVQLGNFTKEELDAMEEKPRRASLPKGVFFDTVTLEEALVYLSLPREIGEHNGEKVIVTTGRFGPYMKVGKLNVSLGKDHDPYTIELAAAKTLIKEAAEAKKKAAKPLREFDEDPVSGGKVLVKTGRFGPYVTDGKTNASLGKKLSPEDVTFEQALELLAKKRKK